MMYPFPACCVAAATACVLVASAAVAEDPPQNRPAPPLIDADAWRKIESREGRFRILLPGEPEDVDQGEDAQAGVLRSRMKVVTLPNDSGACLAGYAVYGDRADVANSEQVISRVCQGMIAGTLVKRNRAMRVGKNSGRELAYIKSEDGQRTYWRARVFLINNVLYQIIVMGTDKPIPHSEVVKVFDSFEVLPQ